MSRYQSAPAARGSATVVEEIDHELVRRVARWELEDANEGTTGDDVSTTVRRIGQAEAGLAADYAAQLARSAGEVVFSAEHVDVMDTGRSTGTRPSARRRAAGRLPGGGPVHAPSRNRNDGRRLLTGAAHR